MIFLFIFGLFLFSSSSFAIEKKTAEQILSESAGFVQLGAYSDAEQSLKQGLNFYPGNADLRFELANLYVIQHDLLQKQNQSGAAVSKLKAAARELEQAVMYRPDSVSGFYNLGTIQKNLGRYEEARKSFQKALMLDPNQVPAILQLGATYEEQGFFEEAESIYRDAQERIYDQRLQNAVQNLYENRDYYQAAESRQRQMATASQMNSMSNALNSYGSSEPNYFNTPYPQGSDTGYGTNYGNNSGTQNALGQAVPLLGQMFAKQLFGSRSSDDE